jgi:hypothetical protein
VLLRERLGEDLCGDEAARDEDLADASSRLCLLLRQRFLEVLPAQPTCVDQKLSEQYARLRRGYGRRDVWSGELRSLHESVIGRRSGVPEARASAYCGARIRT